MSKHDPLSDILRVLRVGGSLVLNDTYRLPWAVSVPAADGLAELTGIAPNRAVAFHFVQRGWFELVEEDGTRFQADRGDLLVSFGGGPHQLACGDGARAEPLENLIGRAEAPDAHPHEPATTLLCGVFSLGALETTPLADGLPRTVHLKGGAGRDFDSLSQLLVMEVRSRRPGMEFSIGRILELICAEALRQVADTAPVDRPSWLRALKDPAVSAAIAAVHEDPAYDWDMKALGGVAAMSPSRLTARFRSALGQSPMAYVSSWRMIVAAHLLTDTDLSVQLVAERVGFTSQPSFTRSFTRHHGTSPRDHRKASRENAARYRTLERP